MREAQLTLHAAVAYPVWNPSDPTFRQQDWTARFITLAVKGDVERIGRGYVDIGPQRYDATNYQQLGGDFHRWCAKNLEQLGIEDPVIVALPNSDATPEKDDFATAALAQGVAAQLGAEAASAYSGLRFREPMQKAREGGERNKDVLLAAMTLVNEIPAGTAVLLDDVCTSGGHLFAAQEKLRLAGRLVQHAIVCGRTVHGPEEKMLKREPEMLSAYWF